MGGQRQCLVLFMFRRLRRKHLDWWRKIKGIYLVISKVMREYVIIGCVANLNWWSYLYWLDCNLKLQELLQL